MRKNNRDGHAGEGELVDKRVNIGRGKLGGGAVVVDHLEVRISLSFEMEGLRKREDLQEHA